MKRILKQLNQRPIAYYPIYRQLTGSTTGGILLSQLMYWFSKKDKIFKTNEEIINETFLTQDEIKSAKRKIKNLAFITVSLEGLPAKTFYKIDWQKYEETLNNLPEQVGGNFTNCVEEKAPTGKCKLHQHTIYTENTTENNMQNLKNSANKKDENIKNNYSRDFNIIWNLYDKKTSNKKRSFEIYKRRFKNINIKNFRKAIEDYKENIDVNFIKDFDGFLNGLVDSYLPKPIWIIDKQGLKLKGNYYENKNTFETEDKEFCLDSKKIAELLEANKFGYV